MLSTKSILNDIRAYLAHFDVTVKYAYDFTLTENELLKLAIAYELL